VSWARPLPLWAVAASGIPLCAHAAETSAIGESLLPAARGRAAISSRSTERRIRISSKRLRAGTPPFRPLGPAVS